MSTSQATDKIRQLKNQYLLFRGIEIALLTASCFLIIWVITSLFFDSITLKLVVSLSICSIIITWRVAHFQLHRFNNRKFITYLNHRYPQLEESADLLLSQNNSLSGLQQLQLQRILQRFDLLIPEIKIPNAIPQSIGIFALILVGYMTLTSFINQRVPSLQKPMIELGRINTKIEKGDVSINRLTIQVNPPAYTNSKPFESTVADIKVPEGSRVLWTVQFSDSIQKASILVDGKDSVTLIANHNSHQANRIIHAPGFYQLQWSDGKHHTSDYFKIEVAKDELPKIVVNNLNQFTKLSFSDQMAIPLVATLSDDYGLSKAQITATVSKGSGESVKFREEKLHFESPTVIHGKLVNAARTLNLKTLGMEPGDELYFYVEAWDNKMPASNYSRTETFFIALQDTTKQVAVDDEGLGVDLMPEYFRSQRQIIIDTEKLLRDRKKKTVQEFKSTSNELGYDQKVLRLKYGQFLGEEFEGQIGPASVDVDHDEKIEDVATKFGHTHDKENEHNLVAEKKVSPAEHQHEGVQSEKENPLAAFAHNHDDGEEATFFVQSVRAKLKAALTVMWDAELYLRLYEPEKSLPYQYTALKLLKEISNDSRIYVHRTGFDPPPLKEEKRLTADLNDIKNSSNPSAKQQAELYPEIRNTLVLIDKLLNSNVTLLSTNDKIQFRKAGQELAPIVLEHPGNYLQVLSVIKKLSQESMKEQELPILLTSIRPILWSVLPKESYSPSKTERSAHALDQQFLHHLEDLKHD